jgi:CRP-like cAMP-binding protein
VPAALALTAAAVATALGSPSAVVYALGAVLAAGMPRTDLVRTAPAMGSVWRAVGDGVRGAVADRGTALVLAVLAVHRAVPVSLDHTRRSILCAQPRSGRTFTLRRTAGRPSGGSDVVQATPTGPGSVTRTQVIDGAVTADLFSPLSEEERRRVVRAARRRRFAKGEVVFHEGDRGEAVHVLESGRLVVRVFSAAGDAMTLSVVSPGDAFGELALLNDSHNRTATVVALEAGETIMLSRSDFTALRRENPGVDRMLVRLLARRIEDLSTSLLEALYVGADRRVMRRLLVLCGAYQGEQPGPVTIPLTQNDLAGMAGTTRPTVNQVLQRLLTANVIALGRGRIDVLDVEALRRRAGAVGAPM